MGEKMENRSATEISIQSRKHPPATYISPQDEVALREGKPTSWQQVSAGLRCNNSEYSQKTKISPENSALDTRLLAELPPHYNPGNQ